MGRGGAAAVKYCYRSGLHQRHIPGIFWLVLLVPVLGFAQSSPELAMRDFASGQVKKGVRSIGFGGDGATWGNYALVWKDAGTTLVDYGDTGFTNGNDFHFSAVGITSPSLWHDLAIYVVALQESTNDVHLNLKSPGNGPDLVQATGNGTDHAVFSKIALPLGHGFSAGVLLAYETSHFNAGADSNPASMIQYQTEWRPSGGFGVTWQPNKIVLIGFRALLNDDLERRTDLSGTEKGTAHSQEYRLGMSIAPWDGALVDVGGTRLEKRNQLSATHSLQYRPNLGFEQSFANPHLAVRFGLDETSATAGFSWKLTPVDLTVAYVNNMAHNRVGDLFGVNSRSLVLTMSLDYRAFIHTR
jgi:hypothetical protein